MEFIQCKGNLDKYVVNSMVNCPCELWWKRYLGKQYKIAAVPFIMAQIQEPKEIKTLLLQKKINKKYRRICSHNLGFKGVVHISFSKGGMNNSLVVISCISNIRQIS